MINRGPPPPVQQSAPGAYPTQGQQPASGQQYQQVNRAPVPQLAQVPPQQQQQQQPQLQQPQQQQQRPPLNRAQVPPQSQVQPNQGNYPPIQRPTQPPSQPQYNPNQASDGQGIRLNQPNPPFRPQIQTQQQRPINPTFNPNVQNRLPTHLEDRNRMATEVNASNANQPSYLISNTDDVDDVIVRPISSVSISHK